MNPDPTFFADLGARSFFATKRKTNKKPLDFHLGHLHSEASEVWDANRHHGTAAVWEGEGGKLEGFGPELADVIIKAVFIAELTGVDLDYYVDHKLNHLEQKRMK